MFSFSMFLPLLLPFLIIGALVALVVTIKIASINFAYRNSSYGQASGNSFWDTIRDKGKYGEFLTYRMLDKLDSNQRILTNIYLPKADGSTTELDLVLLNQTGIYIIESKNYSGWIFGDEKEKTWTQSLKGGKKNKFLNPVYQNRGHIKELCKVLSHIDSNHFFSYVVFSERCELKKISFSSDRVKILKRDFLEKALLADIKSRKMVLSNEQVNSTYELLSKFVRANDFIKAQHIQRVQSKYGS